ncbi:hypothetical protein [Caldimonas sp. KR1-144]|uniref:hypothetical protein n=1 Tax=Caldimonas sp. KR1-144 TaxID=3400911 RepID=UPI003C124684
MLVRIDLTHRPDAGFAYRVSVPDQEGYEDEGLASIDLAIVGALAGLEPGTRAVQLSFDGVVSGTYPLKVLSANVEQLARHAVLTAQAVRQAMS